MKEKITIAKTAGFCFGVDRAVNMVNELVDKGENVATLGPIIHNPQMVESLKERGVRIISSPDEAQPDETVVIRSHGIEKAVTDELKSRSINVADATCPFVAKIHKIVNSADDNNTVIIAGDKSHPEVRGIVGHCSCETKVVKDEDELNFALSTASNEGKTVILVAQTTFNMSKWKTFKKITEKVYTNSKIFDTICGATLARQTEADELSRKVDAMLVVGGKQSSNTAKLYEICSKNSPTEYIETASEINPHRFKNVHCVGVTAGASTPGCIIKEVQTVMSEILENIGEEFDFAAALEETVKPVHNGEIVKGVVVGITPTEVQVDIGTKHAGYVAADEFAGNLPVVGDELNLVIYRINDVEGTVGLSKRRFDAMKGWNDIVAAKDSGDVLEGKVESAVNGGVIVRVNGCKVFVPASLASSRRVEDLSTLVGNVVRLKVIDVDTRRRRVVGSVRTVEREERKAAAEAVWSSIEVGMKYTGTVKSMTSYGAFVDIGGVDGMIHISELSWSKINNPAQVLSVGQTVEVFVKAIDAEKKKISLGYRKDEDNPWTKFNAEYKVGDVVNVTIVNIVPFGAFAQIIPGIDGLIHISQLSNSHVAKVADAVSVGDKVDAEIIGIDAENSRISLSVKSLLAPAEEANEDTAAEEAPEEEVTEE